MSGLGKRVGLGIPHARLQADVKPVDVSGHDRDSLPEIKVATPDFR
jgi:hypothetical protein